MIREPQDVMDESRRATKCWVIKPSASKAEPRDGVYVYESESESENEGEDELNLRLSVRSIPTQCGISFALFSMRDDIKHLSQLGVEVSFTICSENIHSGCDLRLLMTLRNPSPRTATASL